MDKIQENYPSMTTEIEKLPSGIIFLDLEFSELWIVVEYFFREDLLGVTHMSNDPMESMAQSFLSSDFATDGV